MHALAHCFGVVTQRSQIRFLEQPYVSISTHASCQNALQRDTKP